MKHPTRFTPLVLVLLLCSIGLPAQIVPPVTVKDEGPHLFHEKDGSVAARWIEGGAVKQKRFAKGAPIALPRFKALLGDALHVRPHSPSKSNWAMPERVLAISDVEGEYARLRTFLKAHRVIDASDRWSYGKGHLVCIGDFVDRGEQVTETLWLIYRLDREARQAGGRVHFILGNHEIMMMGGDIRYTAPKYHGVAARLGVSVPGLLGADTEIGRWLRAQNTIVRIGDLVFVHAGLAPELVCPMFDHQGINDLVRRGMGKPTTDLDNHTLEVLWGRRGPLWYRGYFPMFSLDFGPTPTGDQLATQMERMGASVVVVGHTKVPEVTYVDEGRRVLAIDTTWVHDAIVRGVLFEGKKLTVLDIKGPRPSVSLAQPGGRAGN